MMSLMGVMGGIRGILFDKDGTLLDFNRTWLPPYRRAAAYLHARFGRAAEPQRLLAHGGFVAESQTWRADSILASGCNREIIACWEEAIGQPLPPAERRAVESIFSLSADEQVPVTDNMAALFTELRRLNIRLGLATMDDEANAHRLLRALGVESLFDFVCGADSGHGVKPGPGMALAFLRACEITGDQVAVVGDSPADLRMGRAAGAALTVGVLSGAHKEADLALWADLVLDDIVALQAALGYDQKSGDPAKTAAMTTP